MNTPVKKNGYLEIDRVWGEDEVSLYFPTELAFSELPDMPEMAAVVEGPIVLAGLCDADKGLYVDPEKELKQTFRSRYEHTYSAFPWKQNTYQTAGQPENLQFVPLYDITDETYTMYFTRKRIN